MKVVGKIDWFQYACGYIVTGNEKCCTSEEAQKKYGRFVDLLMRGMYDDPFVKEILSIIIPEELIGLCKGNVVKLDRGMRAYRYCIQFNDVQIFLPFRSVNEGDYDESGSLKHDYSYTNPYTDDIEVYNEYVGICVAFQGHVLPKGFTGFNVYKWMLQLIGGGYCFCVQRLDAAYDVNEHFVVFHDYFDAHPEAFRTKSFKSSYTSQYNSISQSGTIYLGNRGSRKSPFIRIYNKYVETIEKGNKESIEQVYPFELNYVERTDIPNSGCFAQYKNVLPWTRFEFEMRGQFARDTLLNWFDTSCDKQAYFPFFNAYLSIYHVESDAERNSAMRSAWRRLSFKDFYLELCEALNKAAISNNSNFVQLGELHSAAQKPSTIASKLISSNSTFIANRKCLMTQVQSLIIAGGDVQDLMQFGYLVPDPVVVSQFMSKLFEHKEYTKLMYDTHAESLMSTLNLTYQQAVRSMRTSGVYHECHNSYTNILTLSDSALDDNIDPFLDSEVNTNET